AHAGELCPPPLEINVAMTLGILDALRFVQAHLPAQQQTCGESATNEDDGGERRQRKRCESKASVVLYVVQDIGDLHQKKSAPDDGHIQVQALAAPGRFEVNLLSA